MALTQISTAGVKDDAVTAGKIPANAVGSSELADDAVDTAAIANDAVTSAKIADGTIVAANIANDTITATQLANNSANVNVIVDGAVTTAKLAGDAVTAAKIADDAVGAEHIEQLDADLSFADSAKAKFGTGNDLEIYHNGSHSIIHDNGTGDLKIIGDDVIIQATNDEAIAKFIENGAVELYYNGTKKLETTSGGVDLPDTLQVDGTVFATGGLKVNSDSTKLRLGASDDIEIYHDGSNSKLTNSTGYFLLHSVGGDSVIRSNTGVLLQPAGGENGVSALANGAVELYYNNSKKLETTNAGGTLTGTWTGAGKILQVVTNTKTDTFSSTTDDAWTDITGATVTITPSSSSNKVFVIFSVAYGMDDYHKVMNFRIVRGTSTAVSAVADASGGASTFHSTTFGLRAMHDSNGGGFVTLTALNSPSSTSAETYKLQYYAAQTGTYYLNRGENDSASYGRGASTFTAMEISA